MIDHQSSRVWAIYGVWGCMSGNPWERKKGLPCSDHIFHMLSDVSFLKYTLSTCLRLGWCHRILGALNNKYWFPTVLEAGKSHIKVPADVVSGEGQFPGLQTAIFSSQGWKRSLMSLLIGHSFRSRGLHLHGLIISQKPHLQYHHMRDLGFSIWIWGETNIQSIAASKSLNGRTFQLLFSVLRLWCTKAVGQTFQGAPTNPLGYVHCG